MRKNKSCGLISAALAGLLCTAGAGAGDMKPPPLPIEPIGIVETLPGQYPPEWFLVHDAAFFHMSDGKVYVVDTSADTVAEQIKGMFNVVFLGNVAQSRRRGEIYATETFNSRGTRGIRTDALTIWDMATLSPKAEVVWPIPKRYTGMPQRYAVTLIDNDELLLAVNFNPATSVTVIDLDTREIVNEVATPGCLFAYPTGKRGFSSVCADGRFMSSELDAAGGLVRQTRTDAFFNSDTSPIFEHPALIKGVAYFPDFYGDVYPVNLQGKVAKVGQPWSLVSAEERAQNWRPGGIGIIDQDELGRFYVLMHADGKDGTQNGGGSEVWVYDAAKKKRVLKIPLQAWGITLAVGRGKKPQLLVTNPIDMSLELYDGLSGKFVRKITDLGQETPLMLHATK